MQFADKMRLDQQSGHLPVVQHNSHKVENGCFSIKMLPRTASENNKLELADYFLSYN